MPRVGFQPMVTAFERAKSVHALDRAATVIGSRRCGKIKIPAPAWNLILWSGLSLVSVLRGVP
jgi:hypothetical protein